MQLEIHTPNGLQPEGQKHNQFPPGTLVPKPEIKITNPRILKDIPGSMPFSFAAAEEVDKWVKTRAPGQNSAQQEFVELSTEHRQFRVDLIDQIHTTIYEGAAAIVFHYKDSPVCPAHIVIIKLDRREDAIPLSRAIAWRRIQIFPYGQYIQGTLNDLTDSPPFILANSVDYYFTRQWKAKAYAKLSAELASVAQLVKDAERKISDQASQITGLQYQRTAANSAQAKAEADYAREHDRAETWKLWAQWLGVTIVIVIVIIFTVHFIWPTL